MISGVPLFSETSISRFPGRPPNHTSQTPSGCFILVDLTSRFCGMVPTKTESCQKNGEGHTPTTSRHRNLLGCPRKLGSMVWINGLQLTYKLGYTGVNNPLTNHLVTSWHIQVGMCPSTNSSNNVELTFGG